MNIPTEAEFIAQVRAFLARHEMKPSRFGREATGEAQLIASIEAGRSPSLKVVQRAIAYMREQDRLAGFHHAIASAAAAEPSATIAANNAAENICLPYSANKPSENIGEADSHVPFSAAEAVTAASSPTFTPTLGQAPSPAASPICSNSSADPA